MKCAILAAGEGSRLAEEGVMEPKPLVQVAGEPMLDRLVRIFEACQADEILLITNNITTAVQEHVRVLQEQGHRLRMMVKTTPSSMHSFYELMPLLGEERFILTTVDTIFRKNEFQAYVNEFMKADEHIDGMMAVTEFVDDEKPLWVATDKELRITGFYDEVQGSRFKVHGTKFQVPSSRFKGRGTRKEQECNSEWKGGRCYVSGGIYGLDGRCFPTLMRCIEGGQSRMRNFQRALIADGLHLQAYPFSKILDVDHAEDIKKAEAYILRNE